MGRLERGESGVTVEAVAAILAVLQVLSEVDRRHPTAAEFSLEVAAVTASYRQRYSKPVRLSNAPKRGSEQRGAKNGSVFR